GICARDRDNRLCGVRGPSDQRVWLPERARADAAFDDAAVVIGRDVNRAAAVLPAPCPEKRSRPLPEPFMPLLEQDAVGVELDLAEGARCERDLAAAACVEVEDVRMLGDLHGMPNRHLNDVDR